VSGDPFELTDYADRVEQVWKDGALVIDQSAAAVTA
jgi:hypothetical protein